jgi:hypothetical protein
MVGPPVDGRRPAPPAHGRTHGDEEIEMSGQIVAVVGGDVGAELDAAIRRRYPNAAAVEYICVDDPADVVLWTVRNTNNQLVFNWRTATGESWPELGEVVGMLAKVVRQHQARGDGLIYKLS